MAAASNPADEVSSDMVAFAEALADAAGAVIQRYWRLPIDVESKNEPGRPVAESPVTIADREVEGLMRQMITSRYPSHGIYGEELGQTKLDAEYCWVLDPIDGTKSFITGKPLFGTLIALLRNGRPILGVIDQCILRERWLGVNGRTLHNGQLVRSRGAEKLEGAMLYATTPHMFAPGVEETRFGRLRSRVLRPLYGCDCYAYALLASGFVDMVVEADLGIYDYCALVPVIANAGGCISDWNGQPLTLQSVKESGGRVLAAGNKALWKQALEILSDDAAQEQEPCEGPWAHVSVVKAGVSLYLLGVACGAVLATLAARRR